MACCLASAKTLSEPMLEYCWLDPGEQISMKYQSTFIYFHSRKCIGKCRLENGSHFVSALMCQMSCCNMARMRDILTSHNTGWWWHPGFALKFLKNLKIHADTKYQTSRKLFILYHSENEFWQLYKVRISNMITYRSFIGPLIFYNGPASLVVHRGPACFTESAILYFP